MDLVQAGPDEAPALWHPDVAFFRVDRAGQPAAYFYLDPYSRPAEKRGGAWMDDVQGRSRALAAGGAAVRLPVAHMVCNQSPPVGATPSLMTFREVSCQDEATASHATSRRSRYPARRAGPPGLP